MTTHGQRTASLTQDVEGPDASSRRGQALSNKLNTVLSSSYADSEIREALRLYDAQYISTDHDLDLHHEAQREVIEANAKIVNDFASVVKQLTQVSHLIDSLNTTCTTIRSHILAARQETAPMLEEASILLAQKQDTEHKQTILNAFTNHFVLTDEDLTILTSPEPLTPNFFTLLARTKQIHTDCEVLLGYENQRLGLELMEQTARHLNAAYKKLYTSTLQQFKTLDLEDPQISGGIRRSLRALSDRPALFQSCLDSFAIARQATVAEGFQRALTESVGSRAIEFSTHDPLRYLGDMLAWVHAATVSEMEALEGLFIADGEEIGRGMHADPFGEEFDGRQALNSLISRNMASVANTLAARVGVTVRNLGDAVEVYKAYNLLTFYGDMFRKLIREKGEEENTILSTLSDLQAQTFKQFETTALEAMHGADEGVGEDLAPPVVLADTLAQFGKIVNTRGPGLGEEEFAKLYGTLVRPVLVSCADLAQEISPQSEHGGYEYRSAAPGLIFKLNYMTLVRQTLSSLVVAKIEVAEPPLQHATNEIKMVRGSLTELLKDQFTVNSGIDEIAELLGDMPVSATNGKRKVTLLETAGEEVRLERYAAKLDGFLASGLMDAQDELGKIIDRESAGFVIKTAVDVFCEDFDKVVKMLEEIDEGVERETLARRMGAVNGDVDEEQDGPTLREVYPRTLAEVQALLS